MKSVATAQAQAQPPAQVKNQPVVRSTSDAFRLSDFVSGDEYSPAKIDLIRRTVAKDCTDLELAYFLSIAKGVGLNPLVKEIWCYKDNQNNLYIFAGRDGFHRLLQECKDFVSINSCEVREGDTFKRGTKNGADYVEHEFGALSEGSDNKKDRFKKRILGAWCIITVKRNGIIDKVTEWADFDRYNKKWNVWSSHPEEMIKKVAEIHAAKKVTNISGIYTEEEFEIVEDEETGIKRINTDKAKIKSGIDKKQMLRQLHARKRIKKSNSESKKK